MIGNLSEQPDCAFPYMHGTPPTPPPDSKWKGRDPWSYVLAECLLIGTRLQIMCIKCERRVNLSCEDIARRHAKWLHLPMRTWARGLRCSGCNSKRITVCELADSVAGASFRKGTNDTAQLIQARRLEWFMVIAARPIEDVAQLVSSYRPSTSFPA